MSTPNPFAQYAEPSSGLSEDNPFSKFASAAPTSGESSKPKRSLMAAVNDTVIEGANAAASTASAVGHFLRPGNAASGWIDKNIVEAGEAAQSDVVKAEKARYADEMQNAQGMGDEVGATLGYVARNPGLAAAQAVGSFAGPGLAIKGATGLAKMAGASAKGTSRTGLAAGAAMGMAGAGGDAAGTAYELSREGGATDAQAVEAARGASVLPGVIGAAGGLVGAERLIAGAKGFGGGLVSRALKTGAVEAAQEAVEEGVTQYEGQRAALPFNPDLDPTKGVAGAATMGAVLGGATGAGTSLLTREPKVPVRKPSADLGLNPDNGVISRAAAGAVDAAVAAADSLSLVPVDGQQGNGAGGLSLEPLSRPAETTGPSMAERMQALPSQVRAQAEQLLREISDERTPEGVKRFRADEVQQLLDANPMPQAPSMDIPEEDRIAMRPIVRGFDPATGQAPAQPLAMVEGREQYEGGVDFDAPPAEKPSSLVHLADWYERSAQANRAAANPLEQVQQQVREGTQYTDPAQVQAASQAVEDAWLALNAGEPTNSVQADSTPSVENVSADTTAETDIRVRAGRIGSAVRNAIDGGQPNTLRVIQYVNQALRTIGEQQLTSAEISRIRRLADARTAFEGLNQPALLPADRQATPTDTAADNRSMESLIPERRAAAQTVTTEQGQSNGSPTPIDNAPQTQQPSAAQSQAIATAVPRSAGGVDGTQAPQAQSTGAQPQAQGTAPAESDSQAAPAQAAPVARKRTAGDNARSRSYETNPMRAFLAKHGVRMDARSEFAPGLQEIRGTLVPGYGPMFRKNGKPLDTLVQNAIEEGYLPEGAAESDLYELIDRAVRQGQRIAPMYTADAAESQMQAAIERQRMFEQEDAERIQLETEAEVAAYEAVMALPLPTREDLSDIYVPALDAASNVSMEDAMRAMGFTDEEVQDAIATINSEQTTGFGGNTSAGQADAGAAQEGAGQGDGGQEGPRQQVAQDEAGFDLEASSREEVLQRQEAQERTQAEQARAARLAEQRARVDRERDEFTLTGSGRAADANGNQATMFSRSKAQDAEYQATVDEGDTAKARSMVQEAAKVAGYSADTSYRMQHRAPNSEDDTSLLDIREAGLVPDDYWTSPRMYLSDPREFSAHSAITALFRQMDARKAAGKKPDGASITVYRAVPKDVKDARIRNGDWVTPSESYARDEGALIAGGYRIISQTVRAGQLYWDGNSAAELGFDDGQEYAYKNTKNNRKLLDAVTRDDEGNVIPLSQRFNARNADSRFSRTERPAASNTTAKNLRRAMSQRTVDGLVKHWAQRPQVVIVDTMQDAAVPKAVRNANDAQQSQGATGEVEGFWHEGKVYLVASALPTSSDVSRVLYHEVLGHHGLRGHFGQALDRVLDQVIKLRPKDVRAKAADYGLDARNPEHLAYAAEEVLTEMAQARPELDVVQRAIAAIRNFLRSHVPGFKSLKLTDADIIEGYLLPARGWVERSEGLGSKGAQARFSFAGQDAVTADLGNLQEAQRRIAAGDSTERVRRETGWHQGVDDKWRFEISDHEAVFRNVDSSWAFNIDRVQEGDVRSLWEVIEHDKLFAAYPSLSNLPVEFVRGKAFNGAYYPGSDRVQLSLGRPAADILSTLLHEIQHGIQHREGFSTGGSLSPEFIESVRLALNELPKAAKAVVDGWVSKNQQLVKQANAAELLARQALMYESAQRLMAYANRESPSGVMRLIRNEMQWIYSEHLRDNSEAIQLQRDFWDIPKPSNLAKRNAFLSDFAYRGAQLLQGSIPTEALRQFRDDTRTTTALVASLRRTSDRARAKLGPLQGLQREVASAQALKDAHDFSGAYDIYRAIAGEVEARNTQTRQAMNEEQRKAKSPWETADVSKAKTIVVYNGTEIAAPSLETVRFSRAPSVQSEAFKRWYGDWQNAVQGDYSDDSTSLDARGKHPIDPLPREGRVGANPDGATRVGDFTFSGASGPVGRDGAPARFFHGTRDDITSFDGRAITRKDNGWLGAGFYFTSEPFIADIYSGAKQGAAGRNTMPVYVAVRKPHVASHAEKAQMKHWSRQQLEENTQKLIEQGYDGAVLEGDDGAIELVAFRNTQIKSATGNNGDFDSNNDDIRFSRSRQTAASTIASSMSTLTPAQEAAWKKVAGLEKVPTLRERFDSFRANFGLRMKQALVDQFAPIAQLDQHAYMLARMSKGSDGTLEAALLYGRPFLRDGVPDVDMKEGGFANVLADLQGEHDRFLMFVAAQRAESLKAQGKENLFSDQDISDLKTLSDGKMPDGSSRKQAYAKALSQLNSFNESVLQMAMESGLIDEDAYKLMKDQPYVPFYRLMEEEGGLQGPSFSKGLTNQKAWKKLKGGTEQLNADLLQNMLLNWGNLYAASARNRAALATMDAADKLAVAYKVPSDTKGVAKVMRDGVTEYWMVEDPYLLEAISALHYQASPLMKPLAAAKKWLTLGVTVNPTFKVRNLIRDVVSSMAMADLSYNPAANVAKGWQLTARDSQVYASMLASGGVIKFGTQEQTDRARKQVAKLSGVMLDKNGAQKLWGQIKDLYAVYDDFGDRTENINRAALYDRLIKKGHSHSEASFMARDLMDFSMGGNATVVRFLTQSVPFLNARLQGLHKLGRAAKDDPRRFATVAMAVSVASLGLLAAYADDEDWKRREDWDRDSYWWFKIGDTAYRIPKPFEVGAIGTLAERTAEAMLDDEMDSKRFMERISHMVSQTFAFDPVPQAFKPLLDIYANKDSFTGRAIESQADQRLRPEDRYSERTSEVARFLGQMGLPDPAQLVKGEYTGLSPKQIDHLLRGYFSWIATAVTTTSNSMLRHTVVDRGESPDLRLKDVFLAGNFMETLPTGGSRYVSAMYEQSRAVEQAFASYRDALASGDQEGAAAILESDGGKIRSRASVATATKLLAQLNAQAKRIQVDTQLDGSEKRERLTQIEQRRHEIAKRVMGGPAT